MKPSYHHRGITKSEKVFLAGANVQPPRPNGLKKFEIGNQIVWAFNMKNAIRKSKLYPHLDVVGG